LTILSFPVSILRPSPDSLHSLPFPLLFVKYLRDICRF
jgi:hypothetical protein